MGGVTGGSGVSGIVQEEVRPRVDWEIPGTCLQVSSMGYGISKQEGAGGMNGCIGKLERAR
jgi:hypothetical protein